MSQYFNKSNHKYGTESFLSMYLESFQFVLGADLENYAKENQNKDNPYNIYFVLKRPKVTIDPSSFCSAGDTAKFNFIVHLEDEKIAINGSVQVDNPSSKLKLITEYPYNLFEITDDSYLYLTARPGSLIDQFEATNKVVKDSLDYEVLYIGQAFGKNGERTAFERLSSHETLQKIYTHALTQSPDSDIWIMLASFSQVSALFSLGDDLIDNSLNNDERDDAIAKNFFENKGLKLSEKQKINFTEAALIKYFEPKYNIEFKNSFPNKNHKSYSECYKLDIRALNIELDTSEMSRKLYTEKVARKAYHAKMFEFENDSDRLSMLGINK